MYIVSIHYKRAPLEIRSLFAFSPAEQIAFLRRCKESGDMAHSVILSTCNRTELYTQFPEEEGDPGRGPDAKDAQRRWERMEEAVCRAKGIPMELCRRYGKCYSGEGALRHLHRVASGVDSMVLGEDEILGQVKDAWQRAMEEKCTDFTLNTVFRSAVTCSKKIKTDTSLSKTSVSVATLAAGRILHFIKERKLQEARVMIIGITGATGSTVMKNIRGQSGISVVGTSRRHGLDGKVTGMEGVEIVPYEKRYESMGRCDIIVSATGSPHYTVTCREWQKAREAESEKGKCGEVLWIDLSVPADIDKNVAEFGTLYQMDYFDQVARRNNEKKRQAKESADLMIEEHLDTLKKELLFHEILPKIPEMKAAAEKLRFEQILYRVRDDSGYEEMKGFFTALGRVLEEEGKQDEISDVRFAGKETVPDGGRREGGRQEV